MDSTQWPQGIGVVEGGGAIRRARPEKDQEVNCPRCNSTNTKFCYYNNYSLSQPRYFCKTCRRYWTEGGSLRNVPVGGGSRKNKRPSSSPSPSPSPSPNSSKNIKLDHLVIPNPSKTQLYQGQDLNLTYPPTSTDHHHHHQDHHLISKFVIQYDQNPNTTTICENTTSISTATANSRGLMSSFMSMMPGSGSDSSTIMYPNGLQDQLKPSGALNFSLDNGFGHEITNTNGARLLFPFEDPNTRGNGDSSTAAGYWTGMLGGEGSW